MHKFQAEKITATTVEWSIMGPADEGGRQVTAYIVEYRFIDEPWDEETTERRIWTRGKYIFNFINLNLVY